MHPEGLPESRKINIAQQIERAVEESIDLRFRASNASYQLDNPIELKELGKMCQRFADTMTPDFVESARKWVVLSTLRELCYDTSHPCEVRTRKALRGVDKEYVKKQVRREYASFWYTEASEELFETEREALCLDLEDEDRVKVREIIRKAYAADVQCGKILCILTKDIYRMLYHLLEQSYNQALKYRRYLRSYISLRLFSKSWWKVMKSIANRLDIRLMLLVEYQKHIDKYIDMGTFPEGCEAYVNQVKASGICEQELGYDAETVVTYLPFSEDFFDENEKKISSTFGVFSQPKITQNALKVLISVAKEKGEKNPLLVWGL